MYKAAERLGPPLLNTHTRRAPRQPVTEEYYEANKEKLKEYREANKEKVKEKKKEWYEKTKGSKCECGCGGSFLPKNRTQHESTKMHQKWLND